MSHLTKRLSTEVTDFRSLTGYSGGDGLIGPVRRAVPTSEGNYSKYANIRPLVDGGTSRTYLADWGPSRQQRVLKVDRIPQTAHAKSNVSRGYALEHGFQLVSEMEDAENHNIVPVRDYFYSEELAKQGHSGIITAEDYFGENTLTEYVARQAKGRLDPNQFGAIFSQVLEAIRYANDDKRVYLRDVHPKNILINENGRIRAAVTDLGNACKVDNVEAKFHPTYASRSIMDPLLYQPGEQATYSGASEAQTIVKDMYFAATGQMPCETNPITGEVVNLLTGESLLNEDGKLDEKKSAKYLKTVILHIPKDMKRYAKLFERGLSLDKEVRYNHIKDLITDFNNARKPSFWEKLRAKKNLVFALGGTGLAISGVGGTLLHDLLLKKSSLEEKLAFEQSTLDVDGQYDPRGVGIRNNYADLRFDMSEEGNWERGTFTDQSPFIPVKPGEKYWGYIKSDQHVLPGKDDGTLGPCLSGKIYIEGREGKTFSIYPDPITPYFSDCGMGRGQIGTTNFNIDIPTDLEEGVHTLAVELYAPKTEMNDRRSTNARDNLDFASPGKILARHRVPIVVGNPTEYIWLRDFHMNGYSDRASFYRPDSTMGSVNKDLEYEASIPEEGIKWKLENEKWNSNVYSKDPRLPKGKDISPKTLQITVRNKKGKVVGVNYMPIERYAVDPKGETVWWRPSIPGPEWSDKLISYRQATEGDSTALKAMWSERNAEKYKIFADSISQAELDSLLQTRETEEIRSNGGMGLGYFRQFIKPKIIDSVKVARAKEKKVHPRNRWTQGKGYRM